MSDALFHRLRLAEVRQETADAVSLAFEVPPALDATFRFTPGQYLTLRAMIDGVEVRRPYSICAGPGGGLRVAVKRVEGGRFSQFATGMLRKGDTIEVMPPAGRFGAGWERGRLHLGIAAGSGITPILAILQAVLARADDTRFVLLYGNRSTTDILFRTALDDLKDRFLSRLVTIHVLSREAQDVPVLSGRLDAARIARLLPGLLDIASIDHAWLCGPGGLIDDARAALAGLGVPAARVQAERFTPAEGATDRASAVPIVSDRTAMIIHDGKTRTVDLGEGEAILDAALRAGLDLPWSCRGGMCSTCRAKLTEGQAVMRENYSLEPWELAAGFILTCQSVPASAHVVVDFDQV